MLDFSKNAVWNDAEAFPLRGGRWHGASRDGWGGSSPLSGEMSRTQ